MTTLVSVPFFIIGLPTGSSLWDDFTSSELGSVVVKSPEKVMVRFLEKKNLWVELIHGRGVPVVGGAG